MATKATKPTSEKVKTADRASFRIDMSDKQSHTWSYSGWAQAIRSIELLNDVRDMQSLVEWVWINRRNDKCVRTELRSTLYSVRSGRDHAISGDVANARLAWSQAQLYAQRTLVAWAAPSVAKVSAIKAKNKESAKKVRKTVDTETLMAAVETVVAESIRKNWPPAYELHKNVMVELGIGSLRTYDRCLAESNYTRSTLAKYVRQTYPFKRRIARLA